MFLLLRLDLSQSTAMLQRSISIHPQDCVISFYGQGCERRRLCKFLPLLERPKCSINHNFLLLLHVSQGPQLLNVLGDTSLGLSVKGNHGLNQAWLRSRCGCSGLHLPVLIQVLLELQEALLDARLGPLNYMPQAPEPQAPEDLKSHRRTL